MDNKNMSDCTTWVKHIHVYIAVLQFTCESIYHFRYNDQSTRLVCVQSNIMPLEKLRSEMEEWMINDNAWLLHNAWFMHMFLQCVNHNLTMVRSSHINYDRNVTSNLGQV